METNQHSHPLSGPSPSPPPSAPCTIKAIQDRSQRKKQRRLRSAGAAMTFAFVGWAIIHTANLEPNNAHRGSLVQQTTRGATPVSTAETSLASPFQVTAEVVRFVPVFQATSDADAYQLVGYQPEVQWVDLATESLPIETQRRIETVMQSDFSEDEFTL